MVGVILGVVAGSDTSSSSTSQTQALHIASVAIFLFLTIIQALQTAILATSSVSGNAKLIIRVLCGVNLT